MGNTLLMHLTDFVLSILGIFGILGRYDSGYGPHLAGFLDMALMAVVILAILALDLALFIIWLERKLMARMMTRRGPTHLGPFGIFQNLSDTLKLLSKEIINPKRLTNLDFTSLFL